jgi:hypothetical protein
MIVESIDQAVSAVRQIRTLSRAVVRARFEQRFTASRMADSYLAAYQSLMDHADGHLLRWNFTRPPLPNGPSRLEWVGSPGTSTA